MSLFRQQPNVTLMTWGCRGSEDFLIAWVLIERHKITCDWLSLAESLKEDYKYIASYKTSMLFIFVYCIFSLRKREWQSFSLVSHLPRAHEEEHFYHLISWISASFQNDFSSHCLFYRNVSKVKRLFIGGATSLDTRWCHKSRKAWKSKTSIWTKRGKQYIRES